MFADVVRIASIIDIQRTRELSVPGQVLVKEGDQVHTEDVIAEATFSSGVTLLNLSMALSLTPDEVEAHIVREIGDELEEGDVVAQRVGAIPRLVRAPADGRLVAVNDGQAVLATENSHVHVKAGLMGSISEIIPEYGAVIQTQGSLVQGVWGNGKVGEGVLSIPADYWTSPLDEAALADVESGQLLAAGSCLHAAVFEAAAGKELAGMILNRLAPELIPMASELSIPVIVLGGFNSGQPDMQTFDILNAGAGKTACVNACEVDLLKGQRPEVIIPDIEGEPEAELGFQGIVAAGQHVRIISGEYAGSVGEVTAVPKSPTNFESGLDLPSAVIQLEDGESVSVPQRNLMILS